MSARLHIHREGSLQFLRWTCFLAGWLWITGLSSSEFSTSLCAQETPAQPAAEQPAETPPVVEKSPSQAGTKPEDQAKAVDHLIYIPYERLSDVIDRFKAKVVLSYEEYMELVRQAREQTDQEPLKQQAILSQARYQATVQGDVAEIKVTLKCKAIKERWAMLPVKFQEMAVGGISNPGEQKVLLHGTGQGAYQLMFPTAGEYEVTLRLMKKIQQSPAGNTLNLNIPAVGITTFSLTVPKPNQKITVAPRHIEIPWTEPVPEKSTAIAVSLGATSIITASWVPDISDRPEMDLLTTVSNQLRIDVRDGLIHTTAALDYKVLRGQLQQLRIAVPKDHRILDVSSSARMEGWNVVQQEKQQLVEIQLLSAVEDRCEVTLHTERTLPQETLALAGIGPDGTVHSIHSLDVTREQGEVRLSHGDDLMVVVEDQARLVRTDLTEKEQAQLAYRYFSPQFTLQVKVSPVQPILDVEHQSHVVFKERRIEVYSNLNTTIRKAGIFQLKYQLPEQFQLLSVNCPQMAEFQHDEKKQSLTIVLKEQSRGVVPVSISGYLTPPEEYRSTGSASFENLPLIEPIGVRQETGAIITFTVDAIELVAEEDQIQNAQTVPINNFNINYPETKKRAAWKYQSRPVTIPIKTVRRPTRLSAQTMTSIEAKPSGIHVETVIDYFVQYAGIDQFRLAVPSGFEDQIEIEIQGKNSVPIQQKTIENREEQDQPWTIWLIQTQRPVIGHQRFRITYDIAMNQNEAQVSEENNIQQAIQESLLLSKPLEWKRSDDDVLKLTRSSGEIVVKTDPALSVSIQGTGTGLEPIDVRELTLLSQQGHQAFRYPIQSEEDPIRLEMQLSRFEVAEVVSTVISRMLTDFVTGTNEDLAIRSRLVVLSSQRQRLIVQLPESAQPMLVQLDGETRQFQKGTTASEAGWTNYVINVGRSKKSDEPFTLSLQYLVKTQPLSRRSLRGEVLLPTPRVMTPNQVEAVVQESRCVVWIPEEFVPVQVRQPYQRWQRSLYASFRSGIRDDTSSIQTHQQWLDAGFSGANFPTDGKAYTFLAVGTGESLQLTYWNRKYVTALLTVLLLLVALILLKTTWENKVLVVLVVIAAMTATLQVVPEVVSQLVDSSTYGIWIVIGVWFCHGLFQLKSCCRRPPDEPTPLEIPDTQQESSHAANPSDLPVDSALNDTEQAEGEDHGDKEGQS